MITNYQPCIKLKIISNFKSTLESTTRSLLALFVFTLLISSITYAQSWTQMGTNIEGIESYCNLGYSIAISNDGYTIVVSGNGLDHDEEDSGYAQVFEWDGTSWVQKGSNLYGDAFEDEFGYSADISADGNTIAIGATQGGSESQIGYVKIFTWSGSSWVMKGNRLNGENVGDHFGSSISLSSDGNTIAVYDRQGINGDYAGSVAVYNWSGTNWTQKGIVLEGDVDDNFGWAISLTADGNTLAVGAVYGYSNHGYARIYFWNGSDWEQKGNDINGDTAYDKFGFSVSINDDGSTVAISARDNSGNGMQSGQLKVFAWNDSEWEQKGNDIYGDGITHFLGWSASLSSNGNIVAVSYTPYSTTKGYDEGHLRIFQWNNTSWVQIGEDLNGNADGDRAGYDSAISSDGSVVAFSAPFGESEIPNAGYVRVFSFTYTNIPETTETVKTIVFPNPTSQRITMKLGKEYIQLNITLKDILGKTIAEYTFLKTINAEIEIPGPKGIYFLELKADNEQVEVFKVFKN